MNLTTTKEIPMVTNSIATLFTQSGNLEYFYQELAETNERDYRRPARGRGRYRIPGTAGAGCTNARRNLREIKEISSNAQNAQTEAGVTRLKDLEKYVYNDAKDVFYFGREIKKITERFYKTLDE